MTQFKALDPNVELSGLHLNAFIKAFPKGIQDVGIKTLTIAGLGNPDPKEWYHFQSLLNVMKDFYENFNPLLLTRMGYQVAHLVEFPSHWDDVDVALLEFDKGYQMNHRGGRIGSYHCEDLGSEMGLRRMKVIVKTPWPCEYELGFIQGISDRFKRNGTEVHVREDNTAQCRNNGDKLCVFIVSWV